MDNSSTRSWFILGFIVFIILYLPIIILNTDMLYLFHDELDGELLTYIMQAKHLFDDSIPEFLNGSPKTSLTMPAPALIVLFKFLTAKKALFITYMSIAIISYVGMFLCANYFTSTPYIAAITGVLFSVLPFYPVYGLSVMGQPLLLFAIIQLYQKKNTAISFIIVLFFVVNSSLILVGYADIIMLSAFILFCILKKRPFKRILAGLISMIIGYVFLNISLLKNILLPSGSFVSHKEDFIVGSSKPLNQFFDLFYHGAYHAESNQEGIVVLSLITLLISIILYKQLNENGRIAVQRLASLIIIATLIAALSALYKCAPVAAFRNRVGGPLLYFQLDRFYWLYPLIWFLVLSLSLYLMSTFLKSKPFQRVAVSTVVAIIFLLQINHCTIKDNFQRLSNGWYASMMYASIDDFYQPELFSKVDSIIKESDKSAYRVASVGLYPSIALYNGYFCLDGYSNNYSLDYKHSFREIIASELAKDETIRDYYDNWGNRCYIFSHELGIRFYLSKNSGITLNDFDINTNKLKELNCRYLFSAVPICNNDKLELVKKLSANQSVYDLYIYKIY